jgi:SAM-dependent methyltransferase
LPSKIISQVHVHPGKEQQRAESEAQRQEREEANRRFDAAMQEFNEELCCLIALPESNVADIGAGEGRLTMMMAERLAGSGHVFAVEIKTDLVSKIRGRCQKAGLKNVTTILGRVRDPRLPEGVVDAAVMVEVYHHLDEPEAFLKNIHSQLKPGAKLYIVEPDVNQPGGDIDGCYADPIATAVMVGKAGFLLEAVEHRDVAGFKFFVMTLTKK